MKKFVCAFLTICMIMSLSVQTAFAADRSKDPTDAEMAETSATFTDVSSNWALKYITYCRTNNIFNGTSATAFSPNGNVTRAQLIVLLCRLAEEGTVAVVPGSIPFTDVKGTEWYAKALSWALGTIYVPDSTTFNATENVSRLEVAVLVYNYLAFLHGGDFTAASAGYADCTALDPYFVNAISYLAEVDIMNGTSKTAFNPNGLVTRAQFSAILYRLSMAILDK